MFELIVLIILLCSLSGIGIILRKKIPILIQLPEEQEGIQKENIISVLKKKIKAISPDKVILLKTVSKIRVLVLKVEKYIDIWLQKIRKKIHLQKQQEEERQAERSPVVNRAERGSTTGEEQKQNGSQNPPIIPPTTPE